MNAPFVSWLALFVFALPVLAAARRQASVDRPMLLIAVWCAFLVLENTIGIAWSHYIDRTNNLIVPLVALPLEATLVLAALSEWQVQPVARTTVRLFIPLYWVLWAVSFMLIESRTTFSTFSGPVLGLLVLMAALFAFVSHIQQDDEPVLDSAWGWILPGLAIFFAINITSTLVSAVGMERQDWPLVRRAIVLKLWTFIFATLLITMGYIWPTRRTSSGSSSSPLPSP